MDRKKKQLSGQLIFDDSVKKRRRIPNSPPKLMNIGAIKLGDSPNHAQQVDAPAAAVARCNQ